MRRIWIMLLLLCVGLVIALPVGAAPPKCNQPGGESLPGCGAIDPADEASGHQMHAISYQDVSITRHDQIRGQGQAVVLRAARNLRF